MKIVVVGGNGLIGAKLVKDLARLGHEALAASRSSGVDTLTGAGLAEALRGAAVVVDVSNSPSFQPAAVLEFFEKSTANQLAAEAAAGVSHHVALSVVGSDRVPDSGYLRAKVAQERLIEASAVPYSIVRATQFFEFVDMIADAATEGDRVLLPTALLQPVAADDAAAEVARVAVGAPLRGTVDVAGPEAAPFEVFVRARLAARNDARTIAADPHARYFGAELRERSLVPEGAARLGGTRFADWLGGPASRS